MVLRPECRHEFPLGVEAAPLLRRVGVLFDQTLTRTGVLLFRDEPTADVVTAYIQCSKFEGSDKSSRSALEDIHGNVYAQMIGVLQFVRRHTSHVLNTSLTALQGR
jgi:predicted HTH transcriptional regulator